MLSSLEKVLVSTLAAPHQLKGGWLLQIELPSVSGRSCPEAGREGGLSAAAVSLVVEIMGLVWLLKMEYQQPAHMTSWRGIVAVSRKQQGAAGRRADDGRVGLVGTLSAENHNTDGKMGFIPLPCCVCR